MQSNNSTIVLLVILLAVLNGKDIMTYVLWLRFKVRSTFKQMENEHRDKASN